MTFISIFNDILGPVMRGPSSSHTAGSYYIAKIARSMLADDILSAKLTFDPNGSYASTYKALGADKAFAIGLLGLSLIDEQFFRVFDIYKDKGLSIDFGIDVFPEANHPNTVLIELISKNNKRLKIIAESTGGGGINIKQIQNWQVGINGLFHDLFIESELDFEAQIIKQMNSKISDGFRRQQKDRKVLLCYKLNKALSKDFLNTLKSINQRVNLWSVEPVFWKQGGKELFLSSEEMVKVAEADKCSLGQIGVKYESAVLGLTEDNVNEEMHNRLLIMERSVNQGLDEKKISMFLTRPSAKKILDSETKGHVAIGGMHTRAAARAMAAMHMDNSKGIVCAAPTGGSAGVLPGVITTLIEEMQVDRAKAVEILFAASAIGLIIAKRATFAAELAGCQVEIGAAGAMAAAAVVEFADGSAQQATDAAAIALQNTMGSVCDSVQGSCEIPCHTRNAVATSNAFVCADLILGGYHNPIPLDETIDATFAVGKTMPIELRCTARGGIAITPSALALKPLK